MICIDKFFISLLTHFTDSLACEIFLFFDKGLFENYIDIFLPVLDQVRTLDSVDLHSIDQPLMLTLALRNQVNQIPMNSAACIQKSIFDS